MYCISKIQIIFLRRGLCARHVSRGESVGSLSERVTLFWDWVAWLWVGYDSLTLSRWVAGTGAARVRLGAVFGPAVHVVYVTRVYDCQRRSTTTDLSRASQSFYLLFVVRFSYFGNI